MKTAYISGHLDLTVEEFEQHYLPLINEAVKNKCKFIVGDAKGADLKAQYYLEMFTDEVTVYHMFTSPRNKLKNYKTIGGFSSDEERDSAMTAASDFDIAWVRPGRENSGTAKNLKRRNK